ncbi:hypothetical protein BASA61_002024 [Batrachochytrium salamandrivorans]|nr:hypothetical protein BASA61_002024 [Batrachochytrium salamandrivorans]KAJ1344810.1 hypothetical protein BSLG_000325 [Batrachochytrium salamandrivorans]
MVFTQTQLRAFGDQHFDVASVAAFRALMFPSVSGAPGPHSAASVHTEPVWSDYCSDCQANIHKHYTDLGWTSDLTTASKPNTVAADMSIAAAPAHIVHTAEPLPTDSDRPTLKRQRSTPLDHTSLPAYPDPPDLHYLDQKKSTAKDSSVLDFELTPEMIEMFRFSEAFHKEMKAEQEQERVQALKRSKEEACTVHTTVKCGVASTTNGQIQELLSLDRLPEFFNSPGSFGISILQHKLDKSFNAATGDRNPILWPVLPIDF